MIFEIHLKKPDFWGGKPWKCFCSLAFSKNLRYTPIVDKQKHVYIVKFGLLAEISSNDSNFGITSTVTVLGPSLQLEATGRSEMMTALIHM